MDIASIVKLAEVVLDVGTDGSDVLVGLAFSTGVHVYDSHELLFGEVDVELPSEGIAARTVIVESEDYAVRVSIGGISAGVIATKSNARKVKIFFIDLLFKF